MPNNEPLVSVMMPAFNAGDTILKALKSLLNQTYKNWQCIVVDDGSTDNTASIVRSLTDKRIKLIQLEKNMGRGYARQVALDNCDGDFVAMLDSDDWYYNNKLQLQIKAFKEHPELTVVSTAMAVTNLQGNITGIRAVGDNKVRKFSKPVSVPVPHAPSMYRKSAVKGISYDREFKLAQDVDFLRRLLINENYMLLDTVCYVYEEQQSNHPNKVFQGYYYSARGYLKFYKEYPITSISKSTLEIIKILRLAIYIISGNFDQLIASRSQQPSLKQVSEFKLQLNTVNTLK